MDEFHEQYYWQIEKEYHEHFDKLERESKCFGTESQ
jgi:hypothetical protein